MKIKKISPEEFWPIFDRLQPKLFKDTLSYSAREVRSVREMKCFPFLKSGLKKRIEIHLGIFDEKNRVIGWCSSHQSKVFELYMMNSAVFPKYRRKGLYSKMVQKTLDEAKKLGFQTVTSNHVLTNNAVIIAKLKLGFKITGFELSDEMGLLVRLTYFLNSVREEVTDFRSGKIKPTKKIKKLFKI